MGFSTILHIKSSHLSININKKINIHINNEVFMIITLTLL